MQEVRVRVPGLNRAGGIYLRKCRTLLNAIRQVCKEQLRDEFRFIADNSESQFDSMKCDLYVNVEVFRLTYQSQRIRAITDMGERICEAMIESGYGSPGDVLTLRHTYVADMRRHAYIERNFIIPEPKPEEEEEKKPIEQNN